MDFTLLIGILGAVIILFSFLMVQLHRWSPDDWIYDILNFVGSGLLIINAALTHAWPFLVLNAIWALSGLYDVIFKDWPPWSWVIL